VSTILHPLVVDPRTPPAAPTGAAPPHGVAWGVTGVVAQIVFTGGWVIAETWQGPRYDLIQNTISDMQAATAPHVWFPILCFALGGLGTFAFVVFGLRPALAEAGDRAPFAPWLLAISALAIGNSFPLIPCRLSDPGCAASVQLLSPGGLTDAIVAGLAFLGLACTPVLLWRRLAVLPSWRRLKPVMFATRVLCPVSYVLLGISSSITSMPAVGLLERVLAITCVLWMAALAVNLISVSSRHPITVAAAAG
jgi:hypothetical membrane protein